MSYTSGTYWRDIWNTTTGERSYLNSSSNEWVTTWPYYQAYNNHLKEGKVEIETPRKNIEVDPAGLLDFLNG